MKHLLLAALIFSSTIAFSEEEREMGWFDFVVEPGLSIGGWGDYSIGNVDQGDFNHISFGGRLALKLGSFFMGFNFLTGEPGGDSSKAVSAADRQTYPSVDNGTLTSNGLLFGWKFNKVYLWYTFTSETLKQSLTTPESYDHEYVGNGHRVNLNFQIYKGLHAGLFYHSMTFDKYTSTISTGAVTDADLPNKLKANNYGLMVTYLFPISSVKDIAKVFKE